jgi:transcriptional regulator with XRE-family HTH domain
MTSIREVLADNLRENRRKLGLTQEKLAEQADVSTHYIAMIETCKKYPKPEMLERLARALNLEPHQLFSVPASPEEALERLHQSIVADMQRMGTGIKQTVRETIREALAKELKSRDGN